MEYDHAKKGRFDLLPIVKSVTFFGCGHFNKILDEIFISKLYSRRNKNLQAAPLVCCFLATRFVIGCR